ncbi:MAG: DUF3488 and transglutaminase-like domain-containing protein [Phycisphaerae bacterium]|jgi:transglutaminase-like putative cysteine protease
MPLRSFTEAEIALKARRRLERPLLATLWLGAMMFALAEGNMFYALLVTFAVAVNLLAVERRHEIFVHSLWVNVAVLVALGVTVLEIRLRNLFLPVALAHFMILIQVCKLFERKTNRDYVQMLALSVLTVVVAAMVCQAMWFAAVLIGYIVLVSYAAMILSIKRGLDSAAEARLVCESAPLSASRVAWNVIRDWPSRAVAGKLVVLLTGMVVAGIVSFFVVPREPGRSAVSAVAGGATAASSSGFSSEVHLGRPRKVHLSDRIVMWVACDEGKAGLTDSLRYFRGRALEGYDGAGWRNAADAMAIFLPPSDSPLLDGAEGFGVAMDPLLLPNLFAPYPTLRWETTEGNLHLRDDLTVSLTRRAQIDRPVRYRVFVLARPATAEQQRYLAQDFAPPRTDAPSGWVKVTDRVAGLARQWCGDLLAARSSDPSAKGQLDLAIARRLAEHLRQNYAYTLDLSDANPGRDGVEDFLFYMNHGNCEYFASALTVMCCALDVPARLVTGFLVSEYSAAEKYYVVRERDAHAWTEVYVADVGWVTVDATPAGVGPASGRSWWLKADELISQWNFQWYNKVVGYDLVSQRRLWNEISRGSRRAWVFVRGIGRAIGQGFVNMLVHGVIDQAMARTAVALGIAATVLEAILLLRIRRHRHSRREAAVALAVRPWGALAFIPAFLDRLESMGPSVRHDRTARQTARQAAEVLHLPAAPLMELVELYYRARWGGFRPGREEIAAAQRQTVTLAGLIDAHRRGPVQPWGV